MLSLHDVQAALGTPMGTTIGTASSSPCESMILVAVLLCTLLRGVRMQENKIAVITLLTHAAKYCDDDTRLQRIVPYLLVRLLAPQAAFLVLTCQQVQAVLACVAACLLRCLTHKMTYE